MHPADFLAQKCLFDEICGSQRDDSRNEGDDGDGLHVERGCWVFGLEAWGCNQKEGDGRWTEMGMNSGGSEELRTREKIVKIETKEQVEEQVEEASGRVS